MARCDATPIFLALACLSTLAAPARAADLKVLTAGAMKQVILASAGEFQEVTKNTLNIDADTVGALVKRIQQGTAFDVAVLTPAAIDQLAKEDKIERGSAIARVGIGVMVKAGAPAPDIGNLEAFKHALIEAKSIAYIDPASGGSSGIYLARLFEQLGLADVLKPKTKLKQGGLVADLVASGEAELGLQQMSEIVSAPGVTVVGPLPPDVQNYTTYAAGIAVDAPSSAAGRALIAWLTRPAMKLILQAKGMSQPP
jgi:molybdate transport system substrate-binding protein